MGFPRDLRWDQFPRVHRGRGPVSLRVLRVSVPTWLTARLMAPSGLWCRTSGAPSGTPGWTQAGTETEERRDSSGWGTARRTGGSVCTPGRDRTGSEETGRAGSTAGTEGTGEAGTGSNLTDSPGTAGQVSGSHSEEDTAGRRSQGIRD